MNVPDLIEEWKSKKYDFCSSDDPTEIDFARVKIPFPQYEKCTPGKYKEEFDGVGMICLYSKVYHIWSDRNRLCQNQNIILSV